MNNIVLSAATAMMIIVGLMLWLVQAIVIFFSVYIALMGFIGLIPVRPRQKSRKAAPARTFAILIPARDEESVITQCLSSLQLQDYPSEQFEVCVVADNCVDGTADLAREGGALTFEHFSETKQTKGYALRFLFEQLNKSSNTYDACVVLDADNVVAPDFVTEMNAAFDAGHHVVQGERVVKNPDDTWLTRLECINAAVASLEQSGRSRLRLPSILRGSAMAFSRQALNVLGEWPVGLDDTESVQTLCVLRGLRIDWWPTAKVYDEQVASVRAFRKQRQRWRKGQKRAFLKYFARSVSRGILDRDPRKFEQGIYIARLQLPVSFLIFGLCAFGVLSRLQAFQALVLAWQVWLSALLLVSVYVLLSAVARRVSWKAYLALPFSPLIILLSVWATMKGWTERGEGWAKTAHGAVVYPDDSQLDQQPKGK